jgi:hypothetical protein
MQYLQYHKLCSNGGGDGGGGGLVGVERVESGTNAMVKKWSALSV